MGMIYTITGPISKLDHIPGTISAPYFTDITVLNGPTSEPFELSASGKLAKRLAELKVGTRIKVKADNEKILEWSLV